MTDDVVEYEHAERSFVVNENLQEEVRKLESEGWTPQPGKPPIMTYYIMRPVNRGGGLPVLHINDDLIFIKKAGE